GPNTVALNTNATSTATINATGNQNLTLDGTALNIANLHTYNGSAGTGQQIVFFNGAGNVAATGGSANDTFVFANRGFRPGPTFTSASSVDGGAGMNELEIVANAGALLGAGDGHHRSRAAACFSHRPLVGLQRRAAPRRPQWTAALGTVGRRLRLRARELRGQWLRAR